MTSVEGNAVVQMIWPAWKEFVSVSPSARKRAIPVDFLTVAVGFVLTFACLKCWRREKNPPYALNDPVSRLRLMRNSVLWSISPMGTVAVMGEKLVCPGPAFRE